MEIISSWRDETDEAWRARFGHSIALGGPRPDAHGTDDVWKKMSSDTATKSLNIRPMLQKNRFDWNGTDRLYRGRLIVRRFAPGRSRSSHGSPVISGIPNEQTFSGTVGMSQRCQESRSEEHFNKG
jgi:hypothetical protein